LKYSERIIKRGKKLLISQSRCLSGVYCYMFLEGRKQLGCLFVGKFFILNYVFKLKNSEEEYILDEKGYEYLTTDKYFKACDIIHNFRLHSSGCAVFQKSRRQKNGKSKMETYYLHKLIAEKFLSKTKTRKKKLVSTLNGNKLDCRIDNLVYRSREQSSRLKKTSASSGYSGVYQEGKRYRVIISFKKKSIHIGMFTSKDIAALAYNEASRYLYGNEGKLNQLPDDLTIEKSDFDPRKIQLVLKKIKK